MADEPIINVVASMPDGLTETSQTLADSVQTLVGSNKELHADVMSMISTNDGILDGFTNSTDVFKDMLGQSMSASESAILGNEELANSLQDSASGLLNMGSGFLGGLGAGKDDSGSSGMFSGKKSKEKPKITDLLKLSEEHSTGFLVLYWKLDDIHKSIQEGSGPDKKKDKSGGGLMTAFKGLAKMAGGLIAVGAALALFAGTMKLMGSMSFGELDKAMTVLGMFGAFVLGSVLLAKLTNKNKQSFKEFGVTILILTASFGLFSAAVVLAAEVADQITTALPTLGAFGLFVGAMALLSKLTNKEKGTFLEFGISIAVLTASLILFTEGVKASADVQPILTAAIPGLAAFTVFVLAMAGISNLVGSSTPAFVLFSAGIVILSAGIILFSKAVVAINTISFEELGQAALRVAAMAVLVTAIGALALVTIPLQASILLMSAAIAAFSGAIILFVTMLNSVIKIPDADLTKGETSLGKIIDLVMGLNRLNGIVLAKVAVKSVAFAAAAVAFTAAMVVLVAMVAAVSLVGGKIPSAIVNTNALIQFLVGKEDSVSAMLAGNEAAFKDLGAFGKAMIPFSTAMISLSEAIALVSEVGNPEAIAASTQSLKDMIKFLVEEGTGDAKSVSELIGALKPEHLKQFKKFGVALEALSGGLSHFARVVAELASGGPAVTEVLSDGGPLVKMFDFIGNMNTMSASTDEKTMKTLKKSMGFMVDAVEPIPGLVNTMSGLTGLDEAMTNIGSITKTLQLVGLLNEATETGSKMFYESLTYLGKGIKEYAKLTAKADGDILLAITDSVMTMSNAKIEDVFDPINKFLSKTELMKTARKELLLMTDAINKANPNGIEKLGSKILSKFTGGNKGVDEASAESNALAISKGRNPEVDTAIIYMAQLMDKWDLEPRIASAGGDTTVVHNNNTTGSARSRLPGAGGGMA